MSQETLTQSMTTETLTSSNAETVAQSIVRAELLSQGIVGPQGPAGEPGQPGSNATMPWHNYQVTLSGNQTVFSVSQITDPVSVGFYVNGLRQPANNFTVGSTTITVTGFTPTTGDDVEILYQ